MYHIGFVVLWVIFKIRSSCTRHFGVLAFPVSLLRAVFRVGLSYTIKNCLKYFYSNVCKDSCFVFFFLLLFNIKIVYRPLIVCGIRSDFSFI